MFAIEFSFRGLPRVGLQSNFRENQGAYPNSMFIF